MIETLKEYLDFLNTDEERKEAERELIEFIRDLIATLEIEKKYFYQLYSDSEILDFFKEDILYLSDREIQDINITRGIRIWEKYLKVKIDLKRKRDINLFLRVRFREFIINVIEAFKDTNLKLEKIDPEIVQEWLNDALEELKCARILYKYNKKDPRGYIYHLEQAIEKSIKGFGMKLGLFKEEDLAEIGHKFSKIYIRILEPIKESKNLENILGQVGLDSEKFELVIKILENPQNRQKEEIIEIDNFIPVVLDFSLLIIRSLINSIKNTRGSIKRSLENIIIFSLPLSFLSIMTSYLYALRYPDKERSKQIDYLQMNITKSFLKITSIVESFIKNFNEILYVDRLIEYYPLSASIEKHLKPIRGVKSDKKRLKTVKTAINDIKTDENVQRRLQKIKSHTNFKDWVKEISIN